MTDAMPLPAADGGADTPRGQREARLLDGVANARAKAATLVDGERLLFLLGAFLTAVGFALIMIGWFGAGDTGLVFEQIPYLISGGLGGLGLMVAGAALYASWWMTRLYRQAREQHEELLAEQRALVEELRALRAQPPAAQRRRRPLEPGDTDRP